MISYCNIGRGISLLVTSSVKNLILFFGNHPLCTITYLYSAYCTTTIIIENLTKS